MNRRELDATLRKIIDAFNSNDSELHDDVQEHDQALTRAIAMWFVGQERERLKKADKGE